MPTPEHPAAQDRASDGCGRTLDTAATSCERAFALWCAEQQLVEDADAPHGEAFYAGWDAGRNDGIDSTLEAVRGR